MPQTSPSHAGPGPSQIDLTVRLRQVYLPPTVVTPTRMAPVLAPESAAVLAVVLPGPPPPCAAPSPFAAAVDAPPSRPRRPMCRWHLLLTLPPGSRAPGGCGGVAATPAPLGAPRGGRPRRPRCRECRRSPL